jgi:hypothetical protein
LRRALDNAAAIPASLRLGRRPSVATATPHVNNPAQIDRLVTVVRAAGPVVEDADWKQ